MFDSNPLRSTQDPNDAAFILCVTDYLLGPLDAPARKALAQARRGLITHRFAMIALARLAKAYRQAQLITAIRESLSREGDRHA